MIVKVAESRRDGKSSFKRLGEYLTAGIYQAGDALTKTSWDRLTQYITAESVLDSLGQDVEKTIAVELGNLNSLKTAAVEMQAVAAQNTRQKDPVYHYIISWPENERPKTADILSAARHTLKALGLQDHQYIVAVHANTDNIHAHIEVNRIHPVTYKAARLEWAHATLHKAARECEIEFGWSHDSGIYNVVEVNGTKQIVRDGSALEEKISGTKKGANLFEVWNGEESLETWCKGEPAADLKRVLDDPKTVSWQDVHRVLGRHGLELRDTGGGGMKVVDVSGKDLDSKTDKILAVSASKAFRFMKRSELETRMGAFEVPEPNLDLSLPTRSYKRDPNKRLERRLQRKELRDALHVRFKEDIRSSRTARAVVQQQYKKTFAIEETARFESLSRNYQEARRAIRADVSLSGQQKQQAYMLAKLSMLQAVDQLKAQIRLERHERSQMMPTIPSWRLWVEQQAQLGDEAAISALRGMIYQDGRNEKVKAKRAQADEAENAIAPANMAAGDPYVRTVRDLSWRVSKNGRVTYTFKSGEPAFLDEGSMLTFRRTEVSDEALKASLLYAADKWRGDIRINGGDAVFKARAVRMATELGLIVRNQELRDMQRNVQEELAHVRNGRPAPKSRPLPSYNLEDRILERNPKAVIAHASTSDNTYRGKVVMESDRHLAQQTGRFTYVVHDKQLLASATPPRGRDVEISYKAGQAVAKQLNSRRGGR